MIVSVLTRDPYLLIDINTMINETYRVIGFTTPNGQQLKDLLVVLQEDDDLMTMEYLDVLDKIHPYISAKLRKRLQYEQS